MANIYKQLDPEDIVTIKKEITRGVFTGNASTLTSFFTGSQASETGSLGRGNYYLNVYNTGSALATSAVQFTVGYGNYNGYGTPTVTTDSSSRLPTQAVYKQYSNTLLPVGTDKFTFYTGSTADGHTSDDIFVINFSRARIKEKLDEGNFELHISGANGVFKFVDESPDISNPTIVPGGIVYNIGSGSINTATTGSDIVTLTASNGEGYGKIYPESGVVIFNPSAIANTIGNVGTVSISGSEAHTSAGVYENLHYDLYDSIVGGGYMKARSSENVSSQNFFVRVRNTEFNFSNNPTYTTGSDNQIINSLYNEPVTYISTVGLYNDNNELLAVAKVSRPIENGRDAESLLKIKVDF